MERVPLDADVFEDLGADSMLLAQFCARARKREDLPSPSMKDVYRHRSVRALAIALAGAAPAAATPSAPTPTPPAPAASRGEHVLCGTLQLLAFLAYTYVAALVAVAGYGWVDTASGAVDTYGRSVLFGGAGFLGASLVPVVAKWMLIGQRTPSGT